MCFSSWELPWVHLGFISGSCSSGNGSTPSPDSWGSPAEPCYAMNAVRARVANVVYILGDDVAKFLHFYRDDWMILDLRFKMIMMIMLEMFLSV